jgi:hypothetical protein
MLNLVKLMLDMIKTKIKKNKKLRMMSCKIDGADI